MNVLYLSSWYPSKQDAMAGLFVKKHVEAVRARGVNVRVNTLWLKADLVQLNVLTLKLGLLAFVLWRVLGIPYIVVEHWSRYLPMNGSYERLPRWKRWLTELIASEARSVYTVSQMLEDNMKRCGIRNDKWGRIENVVDSFFYDDVACRPSSDGKFRFLHVSCFEDRSKNIMGLLRAVKKLSDIRRDFVFTLVGTGADWRACRQYADTLSIPDDVLKWTGEVTPDEVCCKMHESDAFVLFSRYENAPVVISESLAVGLPIVTSRAGGVPEMVSAECGLLVDVEDEDGLTQSMSRMIDHSGDFSKLAIKEYGKKYSFDIVGRKLLGIYVDTLK